MDVCTKMFVSEKKQNKKIREHKCSWREKGLNKLWYLCYRIFYSY